MRTTILFAVLIAALSGGAWAKERPYDLLEIDNWNVKWGEARLGSGAVVTYAFARKEHSFPSARNCSQMAPLGRLLDKSKLSEVAFRAEAEKAFAAWSRVADIKFVPAVDGEKPDIMIGTQAVPIGRAFANVRLTERFQIAANQAGRELSAIVKKRSSERSRKPLGIGGISQALICLNPLHGWKIGRDGDEEVYDLSYTLMHEIGHTIGLDHAGSRGQLMSFRYQEKLLGLQHGDILGAQRLYGAPRQRD